MSLLTVLRGSNKFWLKDVLMGAGLTIGTSTVILSAITALIGQFKNEITQLPPDVLQFAHLAGIDYAISVVLGATLTKAVQDSTKLMLKRIE